MIGDSRRRVSPGRLFEIFPPGYGLSGRDRKELWRGVKMVLTAVKSRPRSERRKLAKQVLDAANKYALRCQEWNRWARPHGIRVNGSRVTGVSDELSAIERDARQLIDRIRAIDKATPSTPGQAAKHAARKKLLAKAANHPSRPRPNALNELGDAANTIRIAAKEARDELPNKKSLRIDGEVVRLLIREISQGYEEITGDRPRRGWRDESNQFHGEFHQLVDAALALAGGKMHSVTIDSWIKRVLSDEGHV